MIADCILGADFLEKFEVTISFKHQCMYTKEENGSRQHQFISEDISKVDLKEEIPLHEISQSNIGVEGERSCCHIEERKDRGVGVLASGIAYNNHKIPLQECAYDSAEKSKGFMQDRVICANQCTEAVDARAMQNSELRSKVEEASCLSPEQKTKLFNVLLTYKNFFTSKPGRCNTFQYEFKVTPEEQLIGHSRPIPFAVRSAVRTQIKQLLEDNIIEPSDSSYLNPLTIVLKEGRSPRICLDARKVNRWTMPDRARVAPINELLQQSHGFKFITSIDLSSAFLQIPL
jgi:hypothetical protein